MVDMLHKTALLPSARQVRSHQHQQHQQQQQQTSVTKDRIIQASFLIPAYQKALPQALLQNLPDDHRLRKIEATCGCKISWGWLPDGLAERYRLLQMAFDPGSRGNYLGALNLLRMYFLGRTAMMPFQQTLLRPDGKQVTMKFPISVDHCRLLMPRRLDRFGRDADGIVANLAKAAAAAKAAHDDECRRLAEQIIDYCLRCLVQQVAFIECESRDQNVTQQVAEVETSINQLVSSVDTLAQCEISRICVRALVEAAEATRLLARLNAPSQASITPPPQQARSVSPSRRRIDFHLSTATSSSTETSKKRTNTRRAPSGSRLRCSGRKQQQMGQKQQTEASPTAIQQANNHHRPFPGRIKRPQHQPPRQQLHVFHPHQPHQKLHCQIQAEHPEESCDTTLADVEAFTFAESEYVNAAAAAKKTPSPVVTGMPGTAAKARTPSNKRFPETLLLCGLQPSAAVALAALDRSDRRLKSIERRTGCRLELRERRCFNTDVQDANEATANADVIQQVSYALQVVPLRPDSRPRGCANMLRTLLRRLDPSGRYFFCVVSASELPTTAGTSGTKVQQKSQQNHQCYQHPATVRTRSKSATKLVELKRLSRQQQYLEEQQLEYRHHQENRWHSEPSTECHSPNVLPTVLASHAGSQIENCIIDCLLGIAASSSAAANAATSSTFERSLEHDRESVLSDALLCVFRSLTANETDARLLDEAMDEAADDAIECADTPEDICSSTAASIGCIQEAIRRTLVACIDERRISSMLGAFSIYLPPQSEHNEPPLSALSLSFSTVTQRVRRRLARLTLTCWEQLCHEAMTTAAGGAAALLAGVAFEAAWKAADSELTLERHQAQQRNHASRFSSSRFITDGPATKEQLRQQEQRQQPTQQQQQQQQQQEANHRRQRSSRRRSRRESSVVGYDYNKQCWQPAYNLEATLQSLASKLITDQVSCACLRAHLMQRFRLRGV